MIEPQPAVLALDKLTKLFGQGDATTVALDNITLRIEKGEFMAIMGPSGCGKTTLLNVLGLLDTATHGEYRLDDMLVEELSEGKRAKIRRNKIGLVFQSFNLVGRLNIIENVALPLTYRGVSSTKRLSAASDMLRTFGLEQREYFMPHQLSGGQLQRVAIARALVNKPSIILADEPTGNLDSKASEIIMRELREIHERGNTIIMVTHNPDLTTYATRVVTMVDGRIASDSKFPPPEPNKYAKRPLGPTVPITRLLKAGPKPRKKSKTRNNNLRRRANKAKTKAKV